MAYHVFTFSRGEGFSVLRDWWGAAQKMEISESRGNRVNWSVPVLTFNRFHSNLATPTDRKLAEWGQRLKYEVGNRPARYAEANPSDERWFFLRDEFVFQWPASSALVADSIRDIGKDIIETFESLGARVVFLPIPTKVSVLRDLLPQELGPAHPVHSRVPTEETENAAAVYQAALSLFPEHSVDLFRTFTNYRRRFPEAVLYGPSDTRWSALAAALAADRVVGTLGGRGPAAVTPRLVEMPGQGGFSEELMADLLQLPTSYVTAHFPQARRREPVYTLAGAASSASGTLVLLGTCDGARLKETDFGLGPLLARALGRTLRDYSRAGEKTIPSFAELVRQATRIRPGDLVVWQFNIREVFAADEKEKIRGYLKQIRDLSISSPLPKS